MTRFAAAGPPGGIFGHLLSDPAGWTRHLAHQILILTLTVGPPAAAAMAGAAVSVLGARWMLRRRRQRRRADGARLVEVFTPPEVEPAAADRFWGALVGLLRPAWRRFLDGQPHLVWQYRFTSSGASIALWVPGPVPPGLIERAVEAAWPAARTRTIRPSPDPLPSNAVVTGGTLRLHGPDVLPLRDEVGPDAVRALMGAAADLRADETAVVHVAARPVTGHRTRAFPRAARALRAGRPPRSRGAALAAGLAEFVTDILLLRPNRSTTAARHDPAGAEAARAVTAKGAGPTYEVLVSYAAASTPADTSRPGRAAARARARGRAHGLASVFALYSGRNTFARRHLHQPGRAFAARRLPRGDLMSVPELAGLARLPSDAVVPGLTRAAARSVPPPPQIRDPAGAGPGAVKILGDADTGHPRPVAVDVTALRHHAHIMGATGSGKSTLMARWVLADAAARRGAVVVEPRGDLVRDILTRLSAAQRAHLVLLDPDTPRHATPVLNPLDVATGTQPDDAGGAGGRDDPTPSAAEERVVDNVVSVFHRIYAAYWGPRTEEILTASCHTLLADRRRTGRVPSLADIPRLLTEPGFRERFTADRTSRELVAFWTWYADLSDTARAQAVGPVLNKLHAFLMKGFVRRVITGPSTVDMAAVLDGGLLLARLPKGTLGEDGSRLLGSLVVAAVWQTATARAAQAENTRRDATLYLDEAHNYLTLPYAIEDLLAEARGYRLSMVLAHQNLAQLPAELREGLAANARNKIFFACSPHDARDLVAHLTPALTAHDLTHLAEHVVAARLVVGHGQTPAFTARTRPLPDPTTTGQRTADLDPPDRPAPEDTAARPSRGPIETIPGDPRTRAPHPAPPGGPDEAIPLDHDPYFGT